MPSSFMIQMPLREAGDPRLYPRSARFGYADQTPPRLPQRESMPDGRSCGSMWVSAVRSFLLLSAAETSVGYTFGAFSIEVAVPIDEVSDVCGKTQPPRFGGQKIAPSASP